MANVYTANRAIILVSLAGIGAAGTLGGMVGGLLAGLASALVIAVVCLFIAGLSYLICAYLRFPKHLRAHLFTAITWTLISGIATLTHLTGLPENKIIDHLILLVAGLVWIPSWQQLREQSQGRVVAQNRRPFFARYLVQTLWGPLIFCLVTMSITVYGNQYFEQSIKRRDLATAFLLRDFGLGKTDYVVDTEDGISLLIQVIEDQDAEAVATYLAIGDVGKHDLDYALSIAIRKDNSMITELLLNYGASPEGDTFSDSYKYAPLYMAADAGKVDQVRTLLRHGANRNIFRANYLNPRYVAHGNKEIVALLKQSGKEKRTDIKEKDHRE